MSTVTRVESSKKDKNRCRIFVDGKFACALCSELVIKFDIKPGMEVDEEKIKEWVREDDRKKAFRAAIKYISFRPRTRKEVRDYLAGKNFKDDVIDSVLENLDDYRFVDDKEFAQMWVMHRIREKPLGKNMIEWELVKKGVDEQIARWATGTITSEDEERMARQLADKYFKKYRKLEKSKMIGKIGRALARRGFEEEIIQKVVRRWILERDE